MFSKVSSDFQSCPCASTKIDVSHCPISLCPIQADMWNFKTKMFATQLFAFICGWTVSLKSLSSTSDETSL